MSDDGNGDQAERRRRATLGASLMLFSPIFLIASLVSANQSAEGVSSADIIVSYMLAIIGLVAFAGGGVFWLRHR